MADITILTEAELRSQVQLDPAAIECVEQAFHALATKAVVMPPIMRLDIVEHNGEIDVKTAYIPGVDSLAIKISPGFFDNPALGLPSINGLMVLFSTRTGMVEALLLDNGYLTDIRTAAAGAVAARCLARADSRSAAIIGAGRQAELQLEALTLVRDIESATLWARDFDKAKAAAATLAKRLGIPVSACDSVQAATAASTRPVPSSRRWWVTRERPSSCCSLREVWCSWWSRRTSPICSWRVLRVDAGRSPCGPRWEPVSAV